MERPYDPQLPVVSTPAASPVSPTQPISIASTAPAGRPGRFLVFRRATRLLFRRWLYAMTLLFRWVRPFAGFAVVIVVLLGVMSWMAVQLWWPSSAPTQRDMRVSALQPAPAIEAFLQGQQAYNADLMWQTYSPAFQAAQLELGATKAVLQSQADKERQGGLRYIRSDYIGGVQLGDGYSMYFYTVDLILQAQNFKVSYVFTADPEGKILKIDSPLTRQQSGNQQSGNQQSGNQ